MQMVCYFISKVKHSFLCASCRDMQVTVTVCAPCVYVCVLSSGRRSCVSARQPRWSRWRGTRPNTWEASRGSIPEREERNTTSTLNTAARSSRRRRRPKPERSVPGTRSSFHHTRYCPVTEVVVQKQWRSESRRGG